MVAKQYADSPYIVTHHVRTDVHAILKLEVLQTFRTLQGDEGPILRGYVQFASEDSSFHVRNSGAID